MLKTSYLNCLKSLFYKDEMRLNSTSLKLDVPNLFSFNKYCAHTKFMVLFLDFQDDQ